MKRKRVKAHDSDNVRTRMILVMKRIISSHPEVRTRTSFAKRIQTISPTISRWKATVEILRWRIVLTFAKSSASRPTGCCWELEAALAVPKLYSVLMLLRRS
jgi:hypothetical protein